MWTGSGVWFQNHKIYILSANIFVNFKFVKLFWENWLNKKRPLKKTEGFCGTKQELDKRGLEVEIKVNSFLLNKLSIEMSECVAKI